MTEESFKKMIKDSPKETVFSNEEIDAMFEIEVQHAMASLCDLVPYDDPNYEETLRSMAEQYVRDINDPNSELNQIARWNDECKDLPHYDTIDFGKILENGTTD